MRYIAKSERVGDIEKEKEYKDEKYEKNEE